MTAPTIIDAERVANLAAFEEVLVSLPGVTEQHQEDLRRAGSATGSQSRYPGARDTLGHAAYAAAALRAMAEALASQQERIDGLEQALSKARGPSKK